MTLPKTMRALVQLHDGYAGTQTGPTLVDPAPFVALRDIPVPTPAKGQAVIKVQLAAVNPSDPFHQGRIWPAARGRPACGL